MAGDLRAATQNPISAMENQGLTPIPLKYLEAFDD